METSVWCAKKLTLVSAFRAAFCHLGRGNVVGRSVQGELLESRTPLSQAGLPQDKATELLTTGVQRARGMIIFFFTPPCHPATKIVVFMDQKKTVEETGCGIFSHAQGKGSSPFEALALGLDSKTLCQGGRYR